LVSEDVIRDPKKPLFFIIALLFVATSFGLHRLRGFRFLAVKFGFAACMILCLLALKRFHFFFVWRDASAYQFLTWLAVFPFLPDRPPRGPWWPAAKRTVRLFREDWRRKDDERLRAKILASVKPADTPQK
jgi:hypothetical protein